MGARFGSTARNQHAAASIVNNAGLFAALLGGSEFRLSSIDNNCAASFSVRQTKEIKNHG
jgi:hypothetical protein